MQNNYYSHSIYNERLKKGVKKMILDVEMPIYDIRVHEQMDLGEVFLKA